MSPDEIMADIKRSAQEAGEPAGRPSEPGGGVVNRVLTIRTRRRAWHWRLDGWRIRPMWKCRRSCPECRP